MRVYGSAKAKTSRDESVRKIKSFQKYSSGLILSGEACIVSPRPHFDFLTALDVSKDNRDFYFNVNQIIFFFQLAIFRFTCNAVRTAKMAFKFYI